MLKTILVCLIPGLLGSFECLAQSVRQPAAIPYSYHRPDEDKESWQRLNLWLSSTFLYIAKEALADQDSCLILASRSLGLSRFSILAEGFGDRQLFEGSNWIDRGDVATGIRLLAKTSGKKHLQQLMLLGAYYVYQPGSPSRHKDSSEYFLDKAVLESNAIKEARLGRIALCLLEKAYLQANDKKADSIYDLLLHQCRNTSDKETEARAIGCHGMYTIPSPTTFLQKADDLQKAADIFHAIGEIESEVNLLTDLGYMLTVMGEHPRAYDVLSKALSLEESIQFPYTHYNTEALAMITYFQGKFGDPLRFTRQTIKTAENCRDSIGWGYFYGRLAILYEAGARQEECVEMAQKAVTRFVIDRNPAAYNSLHPIVVYLSQQGHADKALDLVMDISKKLGPNIIVSDLFFYHGILVTCYTNLGRLDLAEEHIRILDSLETIAEATRGPLRRTLVNDYFAEIALKRGQYQKAIEYLDKRFKYPSYSHHTLASEMDAHRMYIVADSALGNKQAVIYHYKEYTRLLDSNFRVAKIRQAEELRVMYETQEKESQIAALHQQAKQTGLIKDLTLIGIAAALIIAVLLYRQNRIKQRNNRIITDKNGQLQDLLADKEWLLKEIHHRVKNNLQIIMSLLDSQSRFIDNDAALTAINDSQRRVQAISLIHQKLYQSENSSRIDMPHYIDELVSYLQDSFNGPSRASIEQDIEPMNLDVAKAIPLGLIINEAVVNAIKYAFPGNRNGIIQIGLKYAGPDHLRLDIRDNGIGLQTDAKRSDRSSLGFSLMQGLARQMGGTFNIENNRGLQISVLFSTLNDQSYD